MEIPSTTERVPAHTEEEANRNILERTEENISFYKSCGTDAIERRLKELDREQSVATGTILQAVRR